MQERTNPARSKWTGIWKVFLSSLIIGNISVAYAAHDCDKAGDSPSGKITPNAKIIKVNDDNVTGINIVVEFKAELTDKDIHKDDPDAAEASVNDTFDNNGAIEWSQETLTGTFSMPHAKVTNYTTQGTPATGKIKLKAKDDGTHFQDLDVVTELVSFDLKIVNPDGVNIASQTPTLNNRPPRPPEMVVPVVLQVTYQGKDLPWSGNLAEKYKQSSNYATVQRLPYAFNSNGREIIPNWNTEGYYAVKTDQSGRLTDVHNTFIRRQLPEGTYYDGSGTHQVGYVDPSNNNKVLLRTFQDEDYLKREAGRIIPVHNEH